MQQNGSEGRKWDYTNAKHAMQNKRPLHQYARPQYTITAFFTNKSIATEKEDTRQNSRRGSKVQRKGKIGTVTQHTVNRSYSNEEKNNSTAGKRKKQGASYLPQVNS